MKNSTSMSLFLNGTQFYKVIDDNIRKIFLPDFILKADMSHQSM
jgi:hypothetical protein